jgi:hypothetical protein
MSDTNPAPDFFPDDPWTLYQSYGLSIYLSETGNVCLDQSDECNGRLVVVLHPCEVPIIAEHQLAAARRAAEIRRTTDP